MNQPANGKRRRRLGQALALLLVLLAADYFLYPTFARYGWTARPESSGRSFRRGKEFLSACA